MAPSTCSRSSTSAPQRESEAKASEGDVEDECDQLRRETRELREKLAQHSKQLRKRKLEGFDSPLRREAKQIQENLLAKTNRLKDRCNELEVESTRRLELPQEVWEKITDELDENDLFPLALSCRFFRQKQKELVAQTRKHGPGSGAPRLVLRTNLRRKPEKGQPASAAYVRFCSEEKVPSEVVPQRAKWIRRLAAFHGHLPLLQKLIKPFHKLQPEIIATAAHDAARGGQLETLKWLRPELDHQIETKANRLEYRGADEPVTLSMLDSDHFVSACKGGHLEIMKWLRSEGCGWDWKECAHAAAGGHMEALKWLRGEGCPWNERTCNLAAGYGHLDVLRWAIDNGCPYEVNRYTRKALRALGLA